MSAEPVRWSKAYRLAAGPSCRGRRRHTARGGTDRHGGPAPAGRPSFRVARARAGGQRERRANGGPGPRPGASSAFWRPVAGHARTVVPDLLGFGNSIRLGTHFHLDDQAAAVVRLVERHGGGPVVLVAHSYGAEVAVSAARDRPDLVGRLVLVAPAAFTDAAQAREQIGGRSWIARKTMNGSPVADVACGTMCLLRRPLTALAPRVAARVSPDIPSQVARDAVRYVWPAYRDALTSLLEDNPSRHGSRTRRSRRPW